MKKENLIRRVAQLTVMCMLCTFCFSASFVAFAATKVTSVLTAISDSADNVSPNLYNGAGGLYLTSVYQASGGGYVGFANDTNYWGTFIAVSDDSVTWDLLGTAYTTNMLWAGGKLITYINNRLSYSSDGKTWGYVDFEEYVEINSVKYEKGYFLMGYYGNNGAGVRFSSDCATWYDMQGDLPENSRPNTFTIMQDQYFIISESYDAVADRYISTGHYTTSITESASTWSNVNFPDGANYRFNTGSVLGADYYDYSGDEPVNIYYLSYDGINWESKSEIEYLQEENNAYSYGSGDNPNYVNVGLRMEESFLDGSAYIRQYVTVNGTEKLVQFTLNGEALPGSPVPQIPVGLTDGVTDLSSAVAAVQKGASYLTEEQKQMPEGIDLLTLLAEEAIKKAANRTVSGDIVISQDSIKDIQASVTAIKDAVEKALAASGVVTARELDAGVSYKTQSTVNVKITVEPSSINTSADVVSVQTPDYAISLDAASLKANAGDSALVITIQEVADAYASLKPTFVASNGKTYKVTFSKPVTENVKVSLPPASGNTDYQAVMNSSNKAVGGKYNPVTGLLEATITTSDTYTVRENQIYFGDIYYLSAEMQHAIKVMASKGIITGPSENSFNPEGTMARADVASLIVKTLSKYDPNADGGFTDVKKSDWFFGSVGSAKKYGYVTGSSATTFSPRTVMNKDEVVVLAAKVLRIEMKYKIPSDTKKYLNTYTDAELLPSWGTTEIALATRENLVVKRYDGSFSPKENMSRGESALTLYRMFTKIW